MNKIFNRAREYMDSLSQGIDPISGAPSPGDAALHQEKLVNCLRYTAGFLQRELDCQPQPEDERRLMGRAAMYMDMLSQGKNPGSREELPKDSVLSQEKLAVCFRYVALVLRQAAEPPRGDLAIRVPPELRERISYSQEPMSPSMVAGQLDECLGCKSFLRKFMYQWFLREGLVELGRENGKETYLPTERGISMGLTRQTRATVRNGKPGETRVVLCDEAAQRLIVDNLDQILTEVMEYWDAVLDCLTPERCIRISCSTEGTSTPDLLRRIEAQLSMKKNTLPSGVQVVKCLAKTGLFEARGTHMYPTERGKAVGITYNNRSSAGKQGISWTEPAQRYLVDHLREVILDLRSGEGYRAAVPV